MIKKEQRDIWLMHAPFSNYSETKVRPVVIISHNSYNRNTEDFIAVHITTRKEHPYMISLSQNDFVNGKLQDESVVRFDTVTRYNENLLLQKIGKVKPEFYLKTYQKIIELIQSNKINETYIT